VGRNVLVPEDGERKAGKMDLQVLLPAKWRGIGRLVFAFRERYEPELEYLRSLLFPGATFVDVGANLGIYTLWRAGSWVPRAA